MRVVPPEPTAFRADPQPYFVTNAGFSGTNSDYIGIDQFEAHVGAPTYTVGGAVTGLTGSGLVL